jgi:hypothetical protein
MIRCDNCELVVSQVCWVITRMKRGGFEDIHLCPHCALRALDTPIGHRIVASIERAAPMPTEGQEASARELS